MSPMATAYFHKCHVKWSDPFTTEEVFLIDVIVILLDTSLMVLKGTFWCFQMPYNKIRYVNHRFLHELPKFTTKAAGIQVVNFQHCVIYFVMSVTIIVYKPRFELLP